MYTPGYYKTDPHALRLRELVRWYGIWRLPTLLLARRFMKPPAGGTWMPGLWDELACPREELPERFWGASVREREAVERLGFVEVGCGTLKPWMNLNPAILGQGRITYLDSTRRIVCSVICVRNLLPAPLNREVETVVTAFAAYFEGNALCVTNHPRVFDTVPGSTVIRMPTGDAAAMCERIGAAIRVRKTEPRAFPDVVLLRESFDAELIREFEARVRRGLFVRMTEDEIAEARRSMPPPVELA